MKMELNAQNQFDETGRKRNMLNYAYPEKVRMRNQKKCGGNPQSYCLATVLNLRPC